MYHKFKRSFFVLLLLAAFGTAFGGLYESNTNYRKAWDTLHDNILFKPAKLYDFQDKVESLTLEDRGALYKDWARTPAHSAAAFYLNLFGVPGLGNFMIGDYTGGGVLLGFMIGGEILSGIGSLFMNMPGSVTYVSYSPYVPMSYPVYGAGYYIGFGATIAGIGFAALSLIAGMITPFSFRDEYNRKLALALKLSEDQAIVYSKPMDPGLPILMNFLPGFGFGSFAQGDALGGALGFTGDTAGIVLMMVGGIYYYMYNGTIQGAKDHYVDPSAVEFANSNITWSAVMLISGISLYGVSKIFQVVKPVLFASDFNSLQKNIAGGRNLPEETMEMGPILPMVLNILPGFGLGSMIQQDALGGVIGTIGETGGLATALIGFYSYLNATHIIGYYANGTNTWVTNISYSQQESSVPVIITGLCIYGVTKLFNIIRPFWFDADKKNTRFTRLSEQDYYFTMSPYVVPALKDQDMEIQFGMNWKLAF